MECACVGQPADGAERLLAGFFGKSCAEEERGFEFLRVTERGGFCRPADGLAAAGIADDVNDVCQNGAGRRRAACAGAGEHDRADAAAQHLDGVQNAGDGGQRLRARDEMRRDEHCERLPLPDRTAKQAKLHPGCLCKRGVLRRDGGNACHADAGRVDVFTEHHIGQNADLAARVDALDIGGRVLLGVAARLRVTERRFVALPVFEHLCEDEIRRAVQNAAHFINFIRAEALAQRMQHRNAAADGGLKQKAHAIRLRKRQQLRAVLGDELLVGCYDVLACGKRAADILKRCAAAADSFYDEKHVCVVFDDGEIRDDLVFIRPVRQRAARQHIRKLQLFTRVPFEQVCVPQQDLRAAPADDAGAENGKLFHVSPPHASLALR